MWSKQGFISVVKIEESDIRNSLIYPYQINSIANVVTIGKKLLYPLV